MSKDDQINAEGIVIDVMPGGLFKVKLSGNTGQIVIAHLAGRLRVNSIKIVMGDSVQLGMSPYDLTKARITRRM